jgi:hypothetical protein
MKKTLQEQYSLIKEGKGHRDVFMKQAKATFPNQFRNAATFDEIVNGLKHKNVIVENIVGTESINQLPSTKKESYEVAFERFLKESQEEAEKAELKTTSKQVEEDLSKGFDTSDKSNPDNLIFDQVMKGYYTEMCEPKNKDKTMEQIKAIVFKNLEKNPIYYTEKGQFGIKDLGYTTEHPGLGTPKEPKGKYKSSGYGDLKENIGKNYPDSIEGEYNGFPQKFDGVDLHSFLVDMLDISNSEDDFIHKVIMGITNDNDSISSQDEQKLRRWYAKNSPSVTEGHKPGDTVIYKGTRYEVVEETETTITLKDKNGNIITKNYNQFKQGEYKGDVNESNLRKIIRESVEKELAAINKEAESEVISTKLEKIEAAIEKRQSQLNKLDEDEDMKALTDKTKIKQAQKDIKTLEKAKAKLEKQLSKVQKKNKDITPTEVIDEDEPIDEAIDDQKVDKVKTSLEDINKTVDDISTKAKDMFEVEGELPQEIINQIVKMHVEDGMEIEDVASKFPEMYDEVIEFLDGYDAGLDYDI